MRLPGPLTTSIRVLSWIQLVFFSTRSNARLLDVGCLQPLLLGITRKQGAQSKPSPSSLPISPSSPPRSLIHPPPRQSLPDPSLAAVDVPSTRASHGGRLPLLLLLGRPAAGAADGGGGADGCGDGAAAQRAPTHAHVRQLLPGHGDERPASRLCDHRQSPGWYLCSG